MQETLYTLSREIEEKSKKSKEEFGIEIVVNGRPRSQPNSRRVTPTRGELVSTRSDSRTTISTRKIERILQNEDLYTGSLFGDVPHGTGKYLWSDGCMYEGEWNRGEAWGKGKFSWPSGATYEGNFEAGRMNGQGTFIGVDGDTYKGCWLCDRKHGFGEKRYANGDVYSGTWKSNLQDGHGRYVWSDGNEYVGEWRNGVIAGKGVLNWANGKRYDGQWENGVPKGKGVFTWGNVNVSKELKTQVHKEEEEEDERDFEGMVARKRSSLDATRNPNPKICVWELNAGDITCDIVDNVEPSMISKEKNDNGGGGGSGRLEAGQLQKSPCWSDNGEAKKPGQTVSAGHKNYQLMRNLQLGIRYSIGKHASILRELRPTDFDPNEKFWTRFPSEGSKSTPPHQSVDFRWKDYCPMVFRHLRELFAIDPADYMLAICGSDALREFSSPGKSGSFFYLTQDERFMIKTVKKSEVKVLTKMLPNYYRHVCNYKNSLVTKFFGVHCVKPVGGQKTRFIVMGNLFCSEYRIHKRFDLKGSSYGRTIDKREGEIDETTTLKDLDLNYIFRLERSLYQELKRQIDRDCEFLEAERIMDYSLLIGLHFRDDYSSDETKTSPRDIQFGKRIIHHGGLTMRGYHLLPDMDWIMEDRGPLIRLGATTPARAERVSLLEQVHHTGSRKSVSSPPHSGYEIFDVVLYFGIIDILQDYDISKKLEHAYKSLQVDPTSISTVDPKLYSKRFRDFINRVFVEDK